MFACATSVFLYMREVVCLRVLPVYMREVVCVCVCYQCFLNACTGAHYRLFCCALSNHTSTGLARTIHL